MWLDGANQCRLSLLFSFELDLAPKWDNPGFDAPKLHQSRVNQASLVRAFQNPEMSTVSVEGIDPLINLETGHRNDPYSPSGYLTGKIESAVASRLL
jgi:hypothetical protein